MAMEPQTNSVDRAKGDIFHIGASWKKHLAAELQKSGMKTLERRLLKDISSKKTVFPSQNQLFSAFQATPFEKVKVVILGQDPYPTPGFAHGLSFSVRPDCPIPRSLANIYKELQADLAIAPADHGYLESWASQGVLLLNAVLSIQPVVVTKKTVNMHRNLGWENFTDRIIKILSAEREGLVFILWGNDAKKKGEWIDRKRHLILESAHPSPLSASRGFFGSKPFSQTNRYLKAQGVAPIQWKLPAKSALAASDPAL
jgi:uracil-DNA glycosylase